MTSLSLDIQVAPSTYRTYSPGCHIAVPIVTLFFTMTLRRGMRSCNLFIAVIISFRLRCFLLFVLRATHDQDPRTAYCLAVKAVGRRTVLSETLHTPRLFPHFLVSQPEFKMDSI